MVGRNKIQRIVYLGLLIGAKVILTRFFSITTPIARIGIGFLPIAIGGILFGPIYAGFAAVIGDLLGSMLFPSGPFFPGFTLSAFISGLVYGCFFYKRKRSFWRGVCVTLIEKLLVSLLLNTYWLYLLTGKGFLILLPTRIMNSVGTIPVMFLLIWFVAYPICDRIKAREVYQS